VKSLVSKLFLNFLSTFHAINKFLFTIDIKLIYFFSNTLIGYIFYIFCIFYGFFGCTGDNCNIMHSLAAIFVVSMIGLVIQTYALVKIPFTRAYLENLVGKNSLDKYLGKYTGSEAVTQIIKYALPALGLMYAEVYSANQQQERFLKAAETTENNFYRDCKAINRIPSDEEYKAMCKVRDDYINKSAHATGIMTRGFALDFFSPDLPK